MRGRRPDRTSSPARFAPLLAAILLAACQSPAARESSVPLQPLTPDGVRDTLVGNTLSRSGGPFWRRWEYSGVQRANGTMTGRVSWSGGEEAATGVWNVSSDSLYCRTWGSGWNAGQRGCFRVSRGGETLVFDHVSGSRGDADRYVYRLRPGKPDGF